MLMRKGATDDAPEVDTTPQVSEKVSSALKARQGKVDKTQAMKMMKQAVMAKPATQQADFILDLLKGFDIKKGAKQRIFMNMRKELGGK
jgi:D-alanine-D-alanine ligase-like ATP-grasp enzyme